MGTIARVNSHSIQKQHKPTEAPVFRRKCGYHAGVKDMNGKDKMSFHIKKCSQTVCGVKIYSALFV